MELEIEQRESGDGSLIGKELWGGKCSWPTRAQRRFWSPSNHRNENWGLQPIYDSNTSFGFIFLASMSLSDSWLTLRKNWHSRLQLLSVIDWVQTNVTGHSVWYYLTQTCGGRDQFIHFPNDISEKVILTNWTEIRMQISDFSLRAVMCHTNLTAKITVPVIPKCWPIKAA